MKKTYSVSIHVKPWGVSICGKPYCVTIHRKPGCVHTCKKEMCPYTTLMHTSCFFLAWYGDRGLVWTHWCTQAVLVYTNPFFTLVYIGGIGAHEVFRDFHFSL